MSAAPTQCQLCESEIHVGEWEQKLLDQYDFPAPTLCALHRHRRRMAHRNERKIYNNVCSQTGKKIISVYPESAPVKVLDQELWWSDNWDPKEYGRDFDFNRPFFEQFRELQMDVPRLSLMNRNGENSQFCNITTDNKNCYLIFGGDYNQDSLEGVFCFHCSDVADTYWVHKSELVFDCMDCSNLYNVKYAVNSHNCQDSSFLQDCRNVRNCFGCVGLINKEYHMFNQALSKEEYEKRVAEYRIHTWSGLEHMRKAFEAFRVKFPHRAQLVVNSEKVTGDRVFDAKNVSNSYDVYGPVEDVSDSFLLGWNAKNVYSCSQVGHKVELTYESMGSVDGYGYAMCTFIWSGTNILYSDLCMNSEELFGCTSLKRSKFCILNKQYSEEEYHEMKGRIIEHMKKTGEWGEFFPIENSPFAYNESVSNDFFPTSKEEALAEGLKWHDEEIRDIPQEDPIPDSIHDVTDDIMKETLVCMKTGRPYRVNAMGLKLWRKLGVPVPRYAPETRNEMRIARRNPLQSWHRNCDECGKEVETSFSEKRPERIYCDECYMKDRY